ncbi:MAG: TIGR02301 family protein [Hyphomonadaceae bacterium]|nr:TIGR02301 family protein [Hyphomonadaceae bacterium]
MRFVLTFLFVIMAAPAWAQSTPAEPDLKKEALKAEERIDENMVTMSNLMEALSNHLGQLHFLRTLCYGADDQKWRRTASDMMNVETPGDGTRRRELIRAFNAGYYMQKERYQTCSSMVAIDVAALSESGRRLSIMLGDPYRED